MPLTDAHFGKIIIAFNAIARDTGVNPNSIDSVFKIFQANWGLFNVEADVEAFGKTKDIDALTSARDKKTADIILLDLEIARLRG